MKHCRKQNMPPRRPIGQSSDVPLAAAPVHRYAHPIPTARTNQRSSTEETLSYILETLSRQSDQLDELLRRTERTTP